MLDRRVPYVWTARRQATSADTFTLHSDWLDDADYVHVHSITVNDLDSQGKTADVGIQRDSYAIYITTIAMATAGVFYHAQRPFILPKGYRLVVRINTPTDEDDILVSATGVAYYHRQD